MPVSFAETMPPFEMPPALLVPNVPTAVTLMPKEPPQKSYPNC
jgi:hypothetical protein